MMKSLYTEYEDWEPGLVDLPSRSRLYPLTPVGIGTSQAESLTSYLMRLAAAHCLSPGTLYKQVIYPLVRAETAPPSRPLRLSSLAVIGIIRAAHSWNGAHQSTSNLVRTLERLTRVPGLRLLTWLPWEAVLASQLLMRRQRVWCPHCLSQWQGEGQTIYEPLLWTLQVVRICPTHDSPLVEVCPGCQRKLQTLSANVRAGHCSWCQQWLGDSGDEQWSSASLRESDQLQEQRWIVESIGELISRAPEVSVSPPAKWVNEKQEDLILRLSRENSPAFSDLAGVRNKIVSLWQGGHTIPRLEFILKLCYRLNLSAIDLLTAMIGRISRETRIDSPQFQSLKISSWKASSSERQDPLLQALEAALLEDPPPHLSEIVRRLGLASTRPVYEKYGEVCRKITARFRDAMKDRPLSLQLPEPNLIIRLNHLLEQELHKKDPRHPSYLAMEVGYRHASTAERQCPELWKALLFKHRQYVQDEKGKKHERIREVMRSALTESPTPTMKELIRRLGYRSNPYLNLRFPVEYHAFKEKRSRQRRERLDELETNLRAALCEQPPRPLTQVAVSLGYCRMYLYNQWPDLCKAIAARNTEYLKECARERRLALKEQVRQIVIELHQSGLHPTRERVIPLLHNPPMACFVTLQEVLREIREELNLPTL